MITAIRWGYGNVRAYNKEMWHTQKQLSQKLILVLKWEGWLAVTQVQKEGKTEENVQMSYISFLMTGTRVAKL